MKKQLVAGIMMSFALSCAVQAELLPLSKAIDTAQENSPDVKQLQAQYDSAIQKTWLAVAPAEPTVQIQYNDMISEFNPGTAASKIIQVMQPIGFPGRAWMTRSSLNDQADTIKYQLRALQLTVSVNVKTAYYNLQLARRNIQLNSDTRASYERILDIAKRRYEAGATGQVDYLNAQVALDSNENDLADLRAAEKVARAQLNVLLKQPVNTPIDVEPIKMNYYPDVTLERAADKMFAGRNEIKAAQATESSAQKAYKLAWMQLLPDFQLILGATEYRDMWASPYNVYYSGQAPTGPLNGYSPGTFPTHTYMAGISFTIPLWFMFNERAVIQGAAYDRAAAERNVDVVNNQSKVALETAVGTLHSNREKIENFEKHILPLSDQSFRLALIDYSSGRIDFQTLSDTAASRRQARLSYATAVVTYLTTYASYEQLTGEDHE